MSAGWIATPENPYHLGPEPLELAGVLGATGIDDPHVDALARALNARRVTRDARSGMTPRRKETADDDAATDDACSGRRVSPQAAR